MILDYFEEHWRTYLGNKLIVELHVNINTVMNKFKCKILFYKFKNYEKVFCNKIQINILWLQVSLGEVGKIMCGYEY